MTECSVAEINNLLTVEDMANEPVRNLMLARIYALTGCSMRSQKRLWREFGEAASIRLFDKMDEFLNSANNLYVLFDKIDEKKTEINDISLKVYNTMLQEFVRSRTIWVTAYNKALDKVAREALKPKCGQPKKGFQYGDF